MSSSQIKEYIIKIRADVKDAQKAIDALGSSLDLEKQTERITKAVGKVTEEIGKLGKSFEEGLSTRNLTNEINTLSTELTASVDKMKDSFDDFSNVFKGLSGDKNSGFGQVFSNFSEQIQNIIDSYKDAVEVLQKLSSGSITQKDVQAALPGADIAKVAEKQAADIDRARSVLETAANNFAKKRNKIIGDLNKEVGEVSSSKWLDYSQTATALKSALDEARKYGNALQKELQDVYEKIGISYNDLDKVVIKGINRQVKNAEEIMPISEKVEKVNAEKKALRDKIKNTKKEDPIVVPLSVVLDVDQFDDAAISTLVSTIQQNIQEKVQAELAKNPIKIPLAFGSAVDTKSIEDKTTHDIAKQFQGTTEEATKGLVDSVQIQVNADTVNLTKQINDKIREINTSGNLSKIEIDVIPRDITGNLKKVDEIANAAEARVIERYEAIGADGVGVASTAAIKFDTSGLATEQTLASILSLLQNMIKPTNPRPPFNPPSGSGGGSKAGGGKSESNATTLPPSNPVSKPTKTVITGQDKPIETKVTDSRGNDVSAKTYNKPRVVGRTTSGQDVSRDYMGRASVRDYFIKAIITATQQQLGLKSLRSMIKSDKANVDTLHQSDLYNASYKFRGNDLALYGRNRESLADFRSDVDNIFNTGKDKIEAKMKEITVKYSDESLQEMIPVTQKITEKIAQLVLEINRLEEEGSQSGSPDTDAINKLIEHRDALYKQLENSRDIKKWQEILIEDNENKRDYHSTAGRAGKWIESNGQTKDFERYLKNQQYNADLQATDTKIADLERGVSQIQRDIETYKNGKYPDDGDGVTLEQLEDRLASMQASLSEIKDNKSKGVLLKGEPVIKDDAAVQFVRDSFNSKNNKIRQMSYTLTDAVREELDKVKNKEIQKAKDDVADELLKSREKQTQAQIKAYNENLANNGVSTKIDTKGITIDSSKLATSVSDTIYEVRESLAEIRKRGQAQLDKFTQESAQDLDSFRRFNKLNKLESRTPEEELEFESYKKKFSAMILNAEAINEANAEMSDLTKKASAGNATEQDIVRMEELQKIINGEDIEEGIVSIEEIRKYVASQLKSIRNRIHDIRAGVNEAMDEVLGKVRLPDDLSQNGFKPQSEADGVQLKNGILIPSKKTYNTLKTSLPNLYKTIGDYQKRMVPREGGGFDTGSLSRNETTDYYQNVNRLKQTLISMMAYEFSHKTGAFGEGSDFNNSKGIYKSLGLDEKMSATLKNMPTRQELNNMSSEQLTALLPELKPLLDFLVHEANSNMTDDEIKAKAIQMVQDDITAIQNRVAELEKIIKQKDSEIAALDANIENAKNNGQQRKAGYYIGKRAKARKERTMAIKEKDRLDNETGDPRTQGTLQDLTSNKQKPVAVWRDGEKIFVTANDLQTMMANLNTQETEFQEKVQRILGISDEQMGNFKELFARLYANKQALNTAFQEYLTALHDENIARYEYLNAQNNSDGLLSEQDRLDVAIRYDVATMERERTSKNYRSARAAYNDTQKEARNAFPKAYEGLEYSQKYSIPENIKSNVPEDILPLLGDKLYELSQVIENEIALSSQLEDNKREFGKTKIKDATEYNNMMDELHSKIDDSAKQRDKIIGEIHQLLPNLSNDDIVEILNSMTTTLSPEGEVGQLLIEAEHLADNEKSIRDLREQANKKNISDKGIAEKRAQAYATNMKTQQNNLTNTVESVQRTIDTISGGLIEEKQKEEAAQQEAAQEAARVQQEIAQKKEELNRILSMTSEELGQYVVNYFSSTLDRLVDDINTAIAKYKSIPGEYESRRAELQSKADAIGSEMSMLSTNDDSPKTFDELVNKLSSGNKRRKNRYNKYIQAKEDADRLSAEIPALKTSEERKQAITKLFDLNKQVATAKEEVIRSIVQDLTEDINNLVQQLTTAVSEGKPGHDVALIADQLKNRLTEINLPEIVSKNGIFLPDGKINGVSINDFINQFLSKFTPEAFIDSLSQIASDIDASYEQEQKQLDEQVQNARSKRIQLKEILDSITAYTNDEIPTSLLPYIEALGNSQHSPFHPSYGLNDREYLQERIKSALSSFSGDQFKNDYKAQITDEQKKLFIDLLGLADVFKEEQKRIKDEEQASKRVEAIQTKTKKPAQETQTEDQSKLQEEATAAQAAAIIAKGAAKVTEETFETQKERERAWAEKHMRVGGAPSSVTHNPNYTPDYVPDYIQNDEEMARQAQMYDEMIAQDARLADESAGASTGLSDVAQQAQNAAEALGTVASTAEKASESVTKEANNNKLTYNGKEYPLLPKEQRTAIANRIKDSSDLSPLMKVGKNSKRKDRNAINRTKQALNAYTMTGDKLILEELNDSFKGGRNGGKNRNISKNIRPGVQAFIQKELGIPAQATQTPAKPDKSEKQKALEMIRGLNIKKEFQSEINNVYKSMSGSLESNETGSAEKVFNAVKQKLAELESQAKQTKNTVESVGKISQEQDNVVRDIKGANAGNEATQRLSESLTELFAKMQSSENEILGLFGNTGLVDEISSGLTNKVRHEDIYRALLSNIENQVFGTIHNHPAGNFVFSGDDFSGIGNDTGSYENGNRLFGLLAEDKVKFVDFSGVDKEIARQFIQQYSQAEKEIQANLNPLLSDQEWHEQFNSLRLEKASELLNQFGLQNIVKTFDVTDTNSISQFLINIQEKAQAAIEPIQKLINLVEFGAEKKLDLGSEEVQNILNAFKSGDLSAIQAFDKLMVNLGSNFHSLSLDDELNKFRTSFKELFGQEFYQNNSDVIQEQLEDQIFDQAKTAEEMMVKARELFKDKLPNEKSSISSGATALSSQLDSVAESSENASSKFREYSEEVAIGMERIARADIVEKAGLTDGTAFEAGQLGNGSATSGIAYSLMSASDSLWDGLIKRGLLADGSSNFSGIREAIEQYVQSFLNHFNLTIDDIKSQLSDFSSFDSTQFGFKPHNKTGNEKGSWQHFHSIDENGHSTDKFEGDYTYKAYARFADPRMLNVANIQSIMKALSDAGFKGQVKIPGISGVDRVTTSSDQLVIHGINSEMQKLAYELLRNQFGNLFSSLKAGFDKTKTTELDGASFSEILVNKGRKPLIEDARKLLQQQQSNETPVSTEQESKKSAADVSEQLARAESNETAQREANTASIEKETAAIQENNTVKNTRPNKYRDVDVSSLTHEELKKQYDMANMARNNKRYWTTTRNAYGSYFAELDAEREKRGLDFTPKPKTKKKQPAELSDRDIVFEADSVAKTTAEEKKLETQVKSTTSAIDERNKEMAEIPVQATKDAIDEDKKLHDEIQRGKYTPANKSDKSQGASGVQQQVADNQQLAQTSQEAAKAVEERNTAMQKAPTSTNTDQVAQDTAEAATQADQLATAMGNVAQQSEAAAAATAKTKSNVSETTTSTETNTNVGSESQQFDGLADTINTSVINAISNKNEALEEEAALVSRIVSQEVGDFKKLAGVINQIASSAKNINFVIDIKGVDKLDATFIAAFNEFSKAIEGINTEKFNAVGNVLGGLKIDKNIGQQFKDFAGGIKEFSETVGSSPLDGNNLTDLLNLISRISDAGTHISDMAMVLKNSSKASKGFFGQRYSKDLKTNQDMERYLELMKELQNPANIAKAAELGRVKDQSQLSAKNSVWLMNFHQMAEEAEQLKKSLKDMPDLTQEGHETLDRTWNNYTNKATEAISALKREMTSFGDETSDKLQQMMEDGFAGKYTEGFNTLIDSLQKLREEFDSGNLSAEKYKQGVNDAFKEFDKFKTGEDKINKLIYDSSYKLGQLQKVGLGSKFEDGFKTLADSINKANNGLRQGTLTADEYKRSVNDAFKEFDRYSRIDQAVFGKNATVSAINGSQGLTKDNVGDYVNRYLSSNYKSVIGSVLENSQTIDNQEVQVFTAKVVDMAGQVQKVRLSWSDLNNEIRMSSTAVDSVQSGFGHVMDNIMGKVKSLYTYWTAQLFNPYRLMGYGKQLVSLVQQYDTAVMEIRKVSSSTKDSLNELKLNSFEMGDSVGATAKDILSSIAGWKRLGKSLEESQEAAIASNWLLNVSEFTNIDDATKSLVSITQAFDDLSYESAIDKLNGVGDAFSSSTDQIAFGMQNVSSVLQVAGNDVDQSIALLAAANDVTQDMSKASMGVRTVALRIAGTEDAKAQLEEAGEDVSDFIVQTRSKVDAKVRKYTATAANPEGISVLEDNGRLRNTYDILLDIANVWDEIVASDNKNGTNRSNALLELLAGKTRSNVLASILQAPDILERAYDTSLNSAGVGQRELDIYLDSIEAKMTQLQNHAHEFANIVINTDSFKTLLDIINALLSGVNSLIKAFGGLKSIVSVVAGIGLQRKGFGIGQFDKVAKSWNFGKLIKPFTEPSTEIQKFFSGMDLNQKILETGIASNAIVPTEIQNIVSNMDDVELAGATWRDVMEKCSTSSVAFGSSLDVVKTGLKAFGNSALGVLSTLGTMAAVMGGLIIIEKVGKWIYDAVKADDILIEKGKEAQQTIQDISKAYQDQKKFVSDNAEDYDKLFAGVNSETNENISLTNEEYERFISLNNEIADLFPQLVSGFDDSGNAIISLGDNASSASEKLAELLKQEQDIANFRMGEQLGDVVAATIVGMQRLSNDKTEHDIEAEQAQAVLNAAKNIETRLYSGDLSTEAAQRKALEEAGFVFDDDGAVTQFVQEVWDDEGIQAQVKISLDAARSALKQFGLEPGHFTKDGSAEFNGKYTSNGKSISNATIDFEANRIEYYEGLYADLLKAFSGSVDIPELSQKVKDALILSNEDEKEMKAKWNSTAASITQSLTSYDGWDEIGREAQTMISKAITSFDLLSTTYDQDALIDNPVRFFRQLYLDPITDAITDSKGKIDEDKAKLVNQLFEINPSDYNAEEYKAKINDLFTQIFGENEEAIQTVKVLFNFVDENGQWNIDAQREAAFQQLGGRITRPKGRAKVYGAGESGITWDMMKSLDGSEIALLQAAYEETPEKVKAAARSVETFKSYIEELKGALKPEQDSSLTELFNNEDYKTAAEGYEKNISSLTSALKTLREEEELSKDARKELQDQFPDMFKSLEDFNEENIGQAAFENLNNWIKLIRESMDETWGEDAIAAAETYIQNLQMMYGDLGVTAENVKNTIASTIITNASSDQIQKYDQLIESFGSDFDTNPEIVASFIADPTNLEGTVEDIIARYDEFKLHFQFVVDENEAAKLIKTIEERASYTSMLEAKNSNKESGGGLLTPENYDQIIKNRESDVEDRNTLIDLAKTEEDRNQAWVDFYEAQSALREAQKAQTESEANGLKRDLENQSSTLTDLQSQLTAATANGGIGSKFLYDSITEAYISEAETNQKLMEKYQGFADSTTNAAWKLEWQNTANEYAQAWQESLDKAEDASIAYTGAKLTYVKNALTDLQSVAQDTTDAMSFRETRGIRPTLRDYKKLLDNSKEQVKNIQKQNKLLREQQSHLDKTDSKWRDIESEINSNNSALLSLAQSQYEWGQNISLSAVQGIMDSFKAAQSAMSKGHLDDSDTLLNLINQNREYADALFTTTTGTYVNAQAMGELVDQQGNLTIAMIDAQKAAEAENYRANEKEMLNLAEQSGITATSIDELNRIISQNPDNPDFADILNLQDANTDILHTIDNLQAMKEEMLSLTSQLGRYQAALQTANMSDNMQTIRGGLEGAKKLWDQGWIGKDDFTTFANLLATNSEIGTEDAIINFEKNYEARKKYLTEDTTGVHRWADDMRELASEFIKLDDAGKEFFDITNMEKFADLMGTSTEFAEDMVMAMADAGYNVDLSRIGDRFAETFSLISGEEANAAQKMHNLINEMSSTAEAGGDISRSAEGAAAALQRMKEAGESPATLDMLVKELNALGELNGFYIDPKTFEVTTKVDTTEVEETKEEVEQGAHMPINVDLTNRPKVSTQKLRDVGWDNAEGDGYGTVYSSSYDDGKGNYVVMTPILPDGDVLEPEALQEYADEVLSGNTIQITEDFDTGNITLGFFKSQEAADNYSEALHGVQEAYYDNDEAFNGLINTLKQASPEDFAKITFGDGKYAEGVEDYERALDGLLNQFGLTQAQGDALLQVLDQMGLIDIKPEVDSSEIDETRNEIDDLRKQASQPIKQKVEVEQGLTVNDVIESAKEKTQGALQVLGGKIKAEIAQKQEEEKRIELETAPIVTATDTVGSNVKTGTSRVVSAINNAADTIVDGMSDKTTASQSAPTQTAPIYSRPNQTTVGDSGNIVKPSVQKANVAQNIPTMTTDSGGGTIVKTVQYKADTTETDKATKEAEEPVTQEVTQVVKQTGSTEVKPTTTTATVKTQMDTSGLSIPSIGDLSVNAHIDANSDRYVQAAQEATKAANEVPKKTEAVITARDQATNVVNTIKDAISSVVGKTVTVAANVKGLDGVIALANKIGGLASKTVNVVSNFITNTIHNKLFGGGATGTAHVSHATGTAYDMWTDYRHSKNAYANGTAEDWSLKDDEEALVNEVGTESIVRDGKWFEIPGGAHVEQLKRGDIVFSSKQTEELKKYGKVYSGGGHGKIAYANGTAYNMINAHAKQNSTAKTSSTTLSDLSRKNVGYSSASTAATKANTAATKANTAATKKSTGNLDNFKKWLEGLVDWIEVRVERLTYQIDLSQAKSENRVGYSPKNADINAAMKVIGSLGTKRNAKTNRWSGGSGLLQDAQNGAIRYLEQANQVRAKAISNGLVNASTADALIKRIKEGAIDINEYNENQREFISQYKEWYDKSLELTSQIEELKQQLKELQQTKLDNIVDDFESLVSWSDAIASRADAMINYYTAAGRVVNSYEALENLRAQHWEASLSIGRYQEEANAYAKELKNAYNIFGPASVEYREALAKYEEIYQQLIESQTKVKELNKAIFELDLTKLQYATERMKQFGEKLASIVSLKNVRGTLFGQSDSPIFESDYMGQVNANNEVIRMLAQDREKRLQEISQLGWEIDSEQYKEAHDAIVQDEQDILKLLESNEELKESIRTLRWKPFTDLQKRLVNAISDLEHLRNLIKADQMFDEKDGTDITAKGYANLALLAQQMNTAKQQIADYRKALDKLDQEYRNNNISLEKYNEQSREYLETLQSSVTAVEGYKDAVAEMYKTQITNENAALQETIQLRKKALQEKKNYYDYDKQLRDQNKDINNLRAQAQALQGVTSDAGVAQLARIRAELAEKEADREELIRNHSFEMQQQGYDQLSEDAQETLDNTLKAIEANTNKQEEVVNMMLGRLKENYATAYDEINQIISHTGTMIGDGAIEQVNQIGGAIEAVLKAAEINIAGTFNTIADSITNAVNAAKIDVSGSVKGIEETVKADTKTPDNTISQIKSTVTNVPETAPKATTVPTSNQVNDAIIAQNNAAAKAQAATTPAKTTTTTTTTTTTAKATTTAQKATTPKVEYFTTKSGKKIRKDDEIYKAIMRGKARSSVPADELKTHAAIWQYITTEYGHELQYSVYSELASIMNRKWGTKFPTNGTKLTSAQKTQMLNLLKKHGYATGTPGVKQDELNWTHQGEIIRRSDGAILRQLDAGTQVVPRLESENLMKWGAIDPNKLFADNAKNIPTTIDYSPSITNNYGALLQVNGDVTRDALPELKEILKQACEYTNKFNAREARKNGYR